MLSRVPGFDRPNASRRSANDRYVSRKAKTMAFSFMKPIVAIFSSAMSGEMKDIGYDEEMGLALSPELWSHLPQVGGLKTHDWTEGQKAASERERDGLDGFLASRVEKSGWQAGSLEIQINLAARSFGVALTYARAIR